MSEHTPIEPFGVRLDRLLREAELSPCGSTAAGDVGKER